MREIRRLLKARSIADIHAGLGRLDAGTAAALSAGARVEGGELQLNRVFESGPEAAPYRTYALLRVLERAGAAEILAAVGSLALRWERPPAAAPAWDILRRLPALRALELRNVSLDLADLPPLRSLALAGVAADLGPLRGWPIEALAIEGRDLTAEDLCTIGALAGLRRLALRRCGGVDLAALSGLSGLEALDLAGCPGIESASLAPFPRLREADLGDADLAGAAPAGLAALRCGAVADPGQIMACNVLVTLDAQGWGGEGLGDLPRALERLALRSCPSLADASALSSLVALETLLIEGAPLLASLPRLDLPRLRDLSLAGCERLPDVDGLAGCPALELADLSGCAFLETVDGLAGCPRLRAVDLSGCANLRHAHGLADLPLLGRVVLGRSWYDGADAISDLQASLREDRSRHQALQHPDSLVTRVRELLVHPDLHHQRQALELLRTFGPELAADVLAGCGIDAEGELIVPFSERAGESLLTALLDGYAGPPLRRLTLRGPGFGGLAPLAGLADLEELRLEGSDDLADLSALARLPRLRRLELSGDLRKLKDLSPLRGCRGLEVLVLRSGGGLSTPGLRPLASLEALRELVLEACPAVELATLAPLKRLTRLAVSATSPPDSLGRIGHLADLEDLEIEDAKLLEDLRPLRGLPRLRRLALDSCQRLRDLSPLAGLAALEEVDLRGQERGDPEPLLEDAAALGDLPGLRILSLAMFPRLRDLSWIARLPRLRVLNLEELELGPDLSPLGGLPEAEELGLSGLGGLRSLDGLEGCARLWKLVVQRCESLRYTDSLSDLPALRVLSFERCGALEMSPDVWSRRTQGEVPLPGYQRWLREFIAAKQAVIVQRMRAARAAGPAAEAALRAEIAAAGDPRLEAALREAGLL